MTIRPDFSDNRRHENQEFFRDEMLRPMDRRHVEILRQRRILKIGWTVD